jgi:hypothetical protein
MEARNASKSASTPRHRHDTRHSSARPIAALSVKVAIACWGDERDLNSVFAVATPKRAASGRERHRGMDRPRIAQHQA